VSRRGDGSKTDSATLSWGDNLMDAEERALLAAVVANPEEDTPRLVYADWLDEHADSLPESRRDSARAKAEYIRLQCEYARLRYESPEHNRKGGKLQSRSLELYREFNKTWVAELNLPANRHTYCWFRRGLVGHIWCTVRHFLNHAEAILAAAPVECLTLRQLSQKNLRELTKCPHIEKVRGVSFLADETPADLVAEYLRVVPTAGLRSLEFRVFTVNSSSPTWTTRNVALARALAGCIGLAGLRWLGLSDAGVGEVGARALVDSPYLNYLEYLDLRDNGIGLNAEPALRFRFGAAVVLGHPDLSRFTMADLNWN
jgi:uncharacterized protein (TIGR02996 family)